MPDFSVDVVIRSLVFNKNSASEQGKAICLKTNANFGRKFSLSAGKLAEDI